MPKTYPVAAVLTFFLSVLLTDMDVVTLFLLVLCYILTGVLLNLYPMRSNIAKYFALGIYFISVVVIPGLHLVYSPEYEIRSIDYERLMSFGTRVYFVAILSFVLSSRLFRCHPNNNIYYTKKIKRAVFQLSFIGLMLLTAFCFIIGLGRMGREAVVLPFYLGGIINLFRSQCVPFLFAIVIENQILNGKNVSRNYFVLYGVWTLFEIIAWMSKGLLMTYFLPVLAVLYFYFIPSLKTIVIKMVPLVIAFLLLYPVVGVMRSVEDISINSIWSTYKSESEEKEANVLVKNDFSFVLTPLNRQFLTALRYVQDYEYIKDGSLFDFSNAPAIVLSRGTAGYQTHVIDGYPEDAIHSSGTTGVMDPLLFGGYGMCYIMVVIIMLIAGYIERYKFRKQYSIFVILLVLVYSLSTGDNVSLFLNGIGLQYIFASLVAIFMAYKINFRKIKGNEKYEIHRA